MRYLILLILLVVTSCNKVSNNFEFYDGIYPSGIDLSHHNCDIEWNKLKVSFVYLKATEGFTYQDPKYYQYLDSCKNNNILVGAYHFFTCSSSGKKQFNNFKTIVNNSINLIPVLDIEQYKNISKKDFQKEICDWIIDCVNYYKSYPIIYTSDLFYIKNLKGNSLIEQCPVWLGDINNYNLSTPHIIHQVTIKKVEGTKYPVDYNILFTSIDNIKLKNF